jgi:hypothetical protein
MGGGFLACLRTHRVIVIDAEAVRVVTRTASRLSIYRPEEGAVLAWSWTERVERRDCGAAARSPAYGVGQPKEVLGPLFTGAAPIPTARPARTPC